jgi:hypothetical protein
MANNPDDAPWLHLSKLLLEKLGDKANGITVEIRETSYGDAAGLYYNANGTEGPAIIIFEAENNNDSTLMLQTMLHEMMHAVTLQAAESYAADGGASLSNAEREAMDELTDIYAHYKQEGSSLYGFSKVSEFIAEAMTDPEFQKFLASKKAKTKSGLANLWDMFLRAVAKFVDASARGTELERTVAAIKSLMDGYQERASAQGGNVSYDNGPYRSDLAYETATGRSVAVQSPTPQGNRLLHRKVRRQGGRQLQFTSDPVTEVSSQ